MQVKSIDTASFAQLDDHKSVKVTYERIAHAVTLRHIESRGGIILVEEFSTPIGESFNTEQSSLPAHYTPAYEKLPSLLNIVIGSVLPLQR